MRIIPRKAGLVAVVAAVALGLAGCGSSGSTTGDGASGSASGGGSTQPVAVVTSTNVWGDIVAQVGGEDVSVTALAKDPAADPHSFEPNAQAQLSVSKADLIVENGGGYDDWMDTMIAASDSSAPVINAVAVFQAGVQAAAASASSSAGRASQDGSSAPTQNSDSPGDVNEHVWYDLPTVAAVAHRVADELGALRPEQASFFRRNADAFADKIAGLVTKVDAIKADHEGAAVAVTEPVPLYLVEAAGLVNRTPAEFSAAIEEGTDVPPTVLNDTLALFTDHQVHALIYNEQTSSPQTQQLLAAARDNNVTVVPVTETLPEGKDYLSWMGANIAALAGALRP